MRKPLEGRKAAGSFLFRSHFGIEGRQSGANAAGGGHVVRIRCVEGLLCSGHQQPAIGAVLGGVMKQTVGRISVPFAVRGTFSDPKIQPGRGIPTISTAPSPGQKQPAQLEPQKKKSILDLFRKP